MSGCPSLKAVSSSTQSSISGSPRCSLSQTRRYCPMGKALAAAHLLVCLLVSSSSTKADRRAEPTHAASASRGHSYFGLIKNSDDAYLIVEACRAGVSGGRVCCGRELIQDMVTSQLLPRVTRRLTEAERTAFIRPGAVFCWEEVEVSGSSPSCQLMLTRHCRAESSAGQITFDGRVRTWCPSGAKASC